MGNDRRGTCRWHVEQQARIKLSGAEKPAPSKIIDINFKGMQISLDLKLPKDTFLDLVVVLADGQPLEMRAWIVWHRAIDDNNVYGLYFSKISDSDKEKIYQFTGKSCHEQLTRQWWQGLEKEGGENMYGEDEYQDRRVFERFPAKMSLRFLNLNTGKEGFAYTRDFSAKGLGLVSSQNVAPHSFFEIWLDIPDKGQPLYTRGEVMWTKCMAPEQYRMGLNLEKADLMGLSRVLRT